MCRGMSFIVLFDQIGKDVALTDGKIYWLPSLDSDQGHEDTLSPLRKSGIINDYNDDSDHLLHVEIRDWLSDNPRFLLDDSLPEWYLNEHPNMEGFDAFEEACLSFWRKVRKCLDGYKTDTQIAEETNNIEKILAGVALITGKDTAFDPSLYLEALTNQSLRNLANALQSRYFCVNYAFNRDTAVVVKNTPIVTGILKRIIRNND